MWRNSEFQAFTDFLRHHNSLIETKDRVRFYGLDLYNMRASMAAVLDYLDRVDPKANDMPACRRGLVNRQPMAGRP